MQKNNIKYGIFGFKGRLAKEVISVFEEKGNQFVYGKDLNEEINNRKPEILIDCSLDIAFNVNVKIAEEYKVPLIVASTGLTNENIKTLKSLSEQFPIVQSNNFSFGIQVLLDLVKKAEKKLSDWDVEITETHHRFKKDKPSGTAKMIKNELNNRDVNISSLRLGNIFGEHVVQFGGLGEVISIKHSATSRRTFAEGILKSAEFILNKKNGLYSFSEVVNN